MLSTLGFDDLFIKELSVYKSKKQFSFINGLIRWATKLQFFFTFFIIALFFFVVNFLKIKGLYEYAPYFNLGLLAILAISFTYTSQAGLRALGEIEKGQLAEQIIKPFALLSFVIIAFFIGINLNDKTYIILNSIAYSIGVLFSIYLFYKASKTFLKNKNVDFEKKKWLKSSKYFFLLSVIYITYERVDQLFLGMLIENKESLANYTVAFRFSEILMMLYAVLNTVISPLYSKLYFNNEKHKLQILFTKSTRFIFLVHLPLIVAIYFFKNYLLGIYGEKYLTASPILDILLIRRFFELFVGPIGYMLAMTGHEKESTIILIFCFVLNCVLNIIFIPTMDAIGAGISATITAIVYNILLSFVAYKKIGVKAGAF